MQRTKFFVRMCNSKNKCIRHFGEYATYCSQYMPMLTYTVSNRLKNQNMGTIFGYFWYILNPLIQILIYYTVFTLIFGKDIENYWIYASSGMFCFNALTSIINHGGSTIITNKNLISKVVFSREMLLFSNTVSVAIPLTINYLVLIISMIILGAPFTWNILFLPIFLVLSLLFALGVSLAASAIVVYVRDIQNFIEIAMRMLFFATPLIYLPETRSSPLLDFVWTINPFYYFIESIHNVIYWGTTPGLMNTMMSLSMSIIAFIAGLAVFKKLEHKFVEIL